MGTILTVAREGDVINWIGVDSLRVFAERDAPVAFLLSRIEYYLIPDVLFFLEPTRLEEKSKKKFFFLRLAHVLKNE